MPFLQNLRLPALPLHSQMAQKARLRSVERFTAATSASILVATDVAARGLDIPNVDVVLHYHLPRAADTYVHRSGRTARAGASGSSILICGPEEVQGVRRLVAKVHAGNSDDGNGGTTAKYFIRTVDLDRRVVSRLKPRASLAKRLADTEAAKQKKTGGSSDAMMRQAAEDLGVEWDSDELEGGGARGKSGRGSQRKAREKQARETDKSEVQAMRRELEALLRDRVNVGVSERYLTSGGVDVDLLLRQQSEGVDGVGNTFLGSVVGMEQD